MNNVAEAQDQSGSIHTDYKMSWTAYVRHVIVFLVLALIGSSLAGTNIWVSIIILAVALGLFIFNVLSIYSLTLYTDENGVWVYSGIFPWSKGVSGVKWRDLEDAVYFPGFFSWLFKSYTVRVGHRFTKTSEIILVHMARGDEAVIRINELHRQILSNSAIE
jgi:membrane-bound ClpP family serine protease